MISGRLRRVACTSRRAARSASIDTSGRFAAAVNHRLSATPSPLNSALRGEPVRIRPGTPTVTDTPSRIISTRRPSANPTAACLAAV